MKKLFFGAAALLIAYHCVFNSPKKFAESLTQCYGHYHGYDGEIEVVYMNIVDWRPCATEEEGPGPNKTCVAVGWALPLSMRTDGRHAIYLYEPWIENRCYPGNCLFPTDKTQINRVVAHETCHLFGAASESLATRCEKRAMKEAGCF